MQAMLNKLIDKLSEAVSALADAVEPGALEDVHRAATLVWETAERLVLLTATTPTSPYNGGER